MVDVSMRRNAVRQTAVGAGVDLNPEEGIEPTVGANTLNALIENMPSLTQSTVMSTWAGSQTLMRGPLMKSRRGILSRSMIGPGVEDVPRKSSLIRNNINRVFRGRYNSLDVFAPTDSFEGKAGYSLYNASRQIDWMGKRVSNMGARAAQAMAEGEKVGSTRKAAARLVEKGYLPDSDDFRSGETWTKGTLSHISTTGRLTRGGNQLIDEKLARNLNNAIEAVNRPKPGELAPTFDPIKAGRTSRSAAYDYAAATSRGSITGSVQGAMVGVDSYLSDMTYTKATGEHAGSKAFNSAAKWAERELVDAGITRGAGKIGLEGTKKLATSTFGDELGKVGAKRAAEMVGKQGVRQAGKAALKQAGVKAVAKAGAKSFARTAAVRGAATLASGPAAPVVGTLMLAWTAFDIAKLGYSLVSEAIIKPSIQLASDAFTSFKGDIQKGPLAGNFEDNSVAATSRQRGVMAIANSRLNARSALGNEAAAMSAHFGGTTW